MKALGVFLFCYLMCGAANAADINHPWPSNLLKSERVVSELLSPLVENYSGFIGIHVVQRSGLYGRELRLFNRKCHNNELFIALTESEEKRFYRYVFRLECQYKAKLEIRTSKEERITSHKLLTFDLPSPNNFSEYKISASRDNLIMQVIFEEQGKRLRMKEENNSFRWSFREDRNITYWDFFAEIGRYSRKMGVSSQKVTEKVYEQKYYRSENNGLMPQVPPARFYISYNYYLKSRLKAFFQINFGSSTSRH